MIFILFILLGSIKTNYLFKMKHCTQFAEDTGKLQLCSMPLTGDLILIFSQQCRPHMRAPKSSQGKIGEQECQVKILIIHKECMRMSKNKRGIQVLDSKLIQHWEMEVDGILKRISIPTR